MNRQILLTFFLFFSLLSIQAQEKGVVLKDKKSNHLEFLKENKRIKLKIKDGKVYVGKFSIVDDKSILIDGTTITLDSVVKIKRRSLVSAIVSPIIITLGVTFVFVGVAGALSGGYGIFLVAFIPPGIPMILVPLISNNHQSEKWEYSIDTNLNVKKI